MNQNKKLVREKLQQALVVELDPYMKAYGFNRRTQSFDYVRTCDAGRQILTMGFVYKPRLDPRANAQIYPELVLCFPEVNQIASGMAGGVHGVTGTADATLWQPMDFVIPKHAHARWFIYDGEDDCVHCIRSIKGYIKEWIIPFLDSYTTVDSLATFYEDGDDRIHPQRHFYIYVAAAYVLLNKPAKAMEVLESKFGRPGARREYAKAYEYLDNLLNG